MPTPPYRSREQAAVFLQMILVELAVREDIKKAAVASTIFLPCKITNNSAQYTTIYSFSYGLIVFSSSFLLLFFFVTSFISPHA
jgi:hypothetical protein